MKAAKIIHISLLRRSAEELLSKAPSNSSSGFTRIFISTFIRHPIRGKRVNFSSVYSSKRTYNACRYAVYIWYISEKFFEKFRLKLWYVFQYFYSAFFCFCFFFFALSYFTYASALILIWFLAINSLETGPMDSTDWTSIGNSPAVAEVSRMISWISFASWRLRELHFIVYFFGDT